MFCPHLINALKLKWWMQLMQKYRQRGSIILEDVKIFEKLFSKIAGIYNKKPLIHFI